MNIILKNRSQLGRFQDNLFRHQQRYTKEEHHSKVISDFEAFFEPSNNIFSNSGATGGNERPSFADLEALANERIGIGRYFTSLFAGKCVRNGWDYYDWENNLIRHPEIFKSYYKAKFFTEQIFWVKYELVYGISFMLKYWTAHDKFHLPPPKKPPIAYKALPPTYIIPTNIGETDMLWEDQARWKFRGGKYNTAEIHPNRVEILCTRPNPNDWIGWSIFESIYLSACAYMNLIVGGLKMIAKAGTVATAFTMNVPNPSLAMYRQFEKLVNEMKANLTFILGKDETIQFMDTKVGSGLAELGEFLKEDMCAGTGLPLNQVYGRADGGGLNGAGALISKQGELETMANYQADLADNYWELTNRYWDVEDEFVKFRLDYQKSDRARYEEEGMQWQNEILKAQFETIKLQNLVTATQLQFAIDNPQIADQSGGNIANQSGGGNGGQKPGNGGNMNTTKETSLQQISKVNQDFISKNYNVIANFKPRIIDAEFRDEDEITIKKKGWEM